MKAKMVLVLMVAAAVLVASGISRAACERCSASSNACIGDRMKYVIEHCGEPDKTIPYENAFHDIVGYELVYSPGSGQFDRHFYFDLTASETMTKMWVGTSR